jgi:hypothetical protein
MGLVDDNRRRGRVNEGRDKQEPQPETEKESSSAPVSGLDRPGDRPNQQDCQENNQHFFHFSLPAQPIGLRLSASFRDAQIEEAFLFDK